MCKKCEAAWEAYEERRKVLSRAYDRSLQAYKKVTAACKDTKTCPHCGKVI
jgi:hypothetical protein